jgi:hypothetical protein
VQILIGFLTNYCRLRSDHAKPEDALLTSGALLMTFGVGSMIGPTMAGGLMGTIGARGLFGYR